MIDYKLNKGLHSRLYDRLYNALWIYQKCLMLHGKGINTMLRRVMKHTCLH